MGAAGRRLFFALIGTVNLLPRFSYGICRLYGAIDRVMSRCVDICRNELFCVLFGGHVSGKLILCTPCLRPRYFARNCAAVPAPQTVGFPLEFTINDTELTPYNQVPLNVF